MALPVTITGISTAVAPVGPFATNLELIEEGTVLGTNSIGGSSSVMVGLPFQTFSANSITDFSLNLLKVGAPTDLFKIELFAADASSFPTGTALGTLTFD